jgi:hypothetical protein
MEARDCDSGLTYSIHGDCLSYKTWKWLRSAFKEVYVETSMSYLC